MAMQLDIVTPEKKVFSDQVDSVLLPGFDGELGILPSHAPLVTILQPGELHYKQGGEQTELVIGEGFVEVTQEKMVVLTDSAFEEAEIDESGVEEAMRRAEEALKEAEDGTSAEDVAALQATIRKSVAQLQFKRKRKQV